MEQLAPNLWIREYPFSLLGGHQGRVVTIIRLASGRLIIHSTAPFGSSDVTDIGRLGTPGWLVDSMLNHDTYAKEGRDAFPDLPYLVPAGFPNAEKLRAQPLLPPPAEWAPEVEVLLIDGMPMAREHVFLHAPSRAIIVADLVFNFEAAAGWTSFFRRTLMGVKEHPDSARLYPRLIKDRAAYDRSIHTLLGWDFDRIIVGHRAPILSNGKELLRQALARKKMLPRG
jgi:hypothetical protein